MSTPADPETGQDKKPTDVTVHVNTKPVELRSHKVTGDEIKQAAIDQGVEIELDFELVEEPRSLSSWTGERGTTPTRSRTRHRLPPDITPTIRGWFAERGFEELAFEVDQSGRFAVGAQRFTGAPDILREGERLFNFVGFWDKELDG